MKFNIEILENGCVIINNHIVATSNLSISEIQKLMDEYKELGTSAMTFTPEALEIKLGRPEFFVSHFMRMDNGCTFGYMSYTVEKVSEGLCKLKDANAIQLKALKEAV